MAAKGTSSKQVITDTILKTFEGSFIAADGKTLRIPMVEDGEVVEIKVTLVAAKDVEGSGAATEISNSTDAAPVVQNPQVTEEEKAKVNKMLENLNLNF